MTETTEAAIKKRITKLVDHIDGCISASAYCARDLKVHVDRREIKAELYKFAEELRK